MSALPPKADRCGALVHVRFVPIADIPRFTQSPLAELWRVLPYQPEPHQRDASKGGPREERAFGADRIL